MIENFRIREEVFENLNDGTVYKTNYQYDKNGVLTETIHENGRKTKYIYDDDGLLFLTETYRNDYKCRYSKFFYGNNNCFNVNILGRKVLRKREEYDYADNMQKYLVYVYSDNALIKTLRYVSDNLIDYEFIHQYENDKRVRTLKSNLELFSTREYDEKGLLKEIKFAFREKLIFTWEEGYTNYEYDMYSVS